MASVPAVELPIKMTLPARVSSTIAFSDPLIPFELIPIISSWPTRSDRLMLATTCAQLSWTVNDSADVGPVLLLGAEVG
jgi:hypothetical protein